nr:5'/3'-nucleotidase SurE [Chitinophagaceae bacterium]
FLNYSFEADMTLPRRVVRELTPEVLMKGLPKYTLLNVNIPDFRESEYKGIRVCRQAVAKWEEEFTERIDPRGKKYYWLTGNFVNKDAGDDTDEWALANGFASVVPVQFDLTAHHAIPHLHKIIGS